MDAGPFEGRYLLRVRLKVLGSTSCGFLEGHLVLVLQRYVNLHCHFPPASALLASMCFNQMVLFALH